MCFLEKKSKFWLFYLNNSKNLRFGEKTNKQTKKKKRNVPRAKYSLHYKSNNLDFT